MKAPVRLVPVDPNVPYVSEQKVSNYWAKIFKG